MIAKEETKGRTYDIKFVNLHFTDILGHLKAVTVSKKELDREQFQEFGLDGSSIVGFTSIENSDLLLKPISDTFAIDPWNKKVGRMFCEIVRPNGEPFPGDTRFILRKYLEKITKEFKLKYFTGSEVEFFLVNGMKPSDRASYYAPEHLDFHSYFRYEMAEILEQFGLLPECLHHEVAPGQHEINFRYSDALSTADNIQTYKFVARKLASKYNMTATFMPKPFNNFNGSGMHIHQSLVDVESGKNVFSNNNEISHICKMFIGGILKYANEILVFLAPTVNSYKRLVPGHEAPVYISWGIGNRSTLIRIPAYKLHKNSEVTVEFRASDPTCNPYIAFTVLLAAGIRGIREKIEPPEPVSENLYLKFNEGSKCKFPSVPSSLKDSIEQCKKTSFARDILGNEGYEIKESEFQITTIDDAYNLNGYQRPPKRTTRKKRFSTKFSMHIPNLKINGFRVELSNKESDFTNRRIIWKAILHHGSGKKYRKETEVSQEILERIICDVPKFTEFKRYLKQKFNRRSLSSIELQTNYIENNKDSNPMKILEEIKESLDRYFPDIKEVFNNKERAIKIEKDTIPMKILLGLYACNLFVNQLATDDKKT